MIGIILRTALAGATALLLGSLAVAQTAAPNPHPLTGHGPSTNAPVTPPPPLNLPVSCSPGFTADHLAVMKGQGFVCRAVATCPSGQPQNLTVGAQGLSFACTPVCPAGFTMTAQGNGTYACQTPPLACSAGTTSDNDASVNGGGEADFHCTRTQ